ncbi:hypothetical protein E4U41_007055 [Claviceps citrina]|nr:hypothetical protein E4U41_007055 [Claviceps citrina]
MPIWWRIVDLPASMESLSPDNRNTAQGAVADAAHVDFNDRQLLALSISSVVAGGLSLVATIVAVASFLRMRRSFRHDLILLLMLSDMLKTLWLVILPATELVRGTIASTSNLCQISGYFLSVGIEACDLAVLLMAAHTGLYIFRGRTGLYPYRFSAYAIVATVSLMLASLAFINNPAFESNALPQSPPIAYHGLIPPTPPYDPAMSNKTLELTSRLNLPESCQGNKSGEIPPFVFRGNERADHSLTSSPLMNSSLSGDSNNGRHRETSNSCVPPYHCVGQEQLISTATSKPANLQPKTFQDPIGSVFNLRIRGQTGLVLDGLDFASSQDETALPQLMLSPTTLNATGMPQVRNKIRRQLGQLFVYPLVYLAGWLLPFISHAMGGDRTGRPFWLVLASLISLCLQGLADSVVFLMMEKPWRYWTTDDVRAWCCFWWSTQSSMKGTGIKVGRTGEEMLIDGTIARRRRAREQAEQRLRSAGRGPKYKDWWDLTLMGIKESSDGDAEESRTIGS